MADPAVSQDGAPTLSLGSGASADAVPGITSSLTGNSVGPPPQTPGPVTPPTQATQLNNHGYFTPTPDQMAKWDSAVAAGMPLDGVDPRVKASFYAAKGGDALATYDSAKTMVIDPGRDAMQKNLGQGWQDFMSNPLGFVVDRTRDAAGWLGAQGASIGKSLDDINAGITGHPSVDLKNLANLQIDKTDPNSLGNTLTTAAAWGGRVGSEALQTGSSFMKSLDDALTFQPGKAAADVAASRQHAMNINALIADPGAKGVNDFAGMVTNAATLMPHLAWNAIQAVPGIPQQYKDQIKERDDQLTYGVLKFQKGMDDWSNGFSGHIADGLAAVGSAFNIRSGMQGPMQGIADQLRQSATTITPAQMEGGRTVLNLFNYVGPGEATAAMHGEAALVRPAFMSAIDASGAALKGLKTEEAAVLSKIGATQDLKTAEQQGQLFNSGQIIADLKEQQAAAATNLNRAQDARTANLPPDGGPPHPQFDQDIAIAQSRLDGVSQQLKTAVANHPTEADHGAPSPPVYNTPKPFVPSTEWQEIPTGMAMPPGGEYKMNFGGKNYARWDNPPPPTTTPPFQAAPSPQASPRTGPPPISSEFDQKLQDLQGSLTDIRRQTQEQTILHQQQIKNAVGQLQRNVGLANQALGGALQSGATTARATTAATKWVGDNLNRVTDWMAQGNPQVAQGLRWALQGAAGTAVGHVFGGDLAGFIGGELAPWIMHTCPRSVKRWEWLEKS